MKRRPRDATARALMIVSAPRSSVETIAHAPMTDITRTVPHAGTTAPRAMANAAMPCVVPTGTIARRVPTIAPHAGTTAPALWPTPRCRAWSLPGGIARRVPTIAPHAGTTARRAMANAAMPGLVPTGTIAPHAGTTARRAPTIARARTAAATPGAARAAMTSVPRAAMTGPTRTVALTGTTARAPMIAPRAGTTAGMLGAAHATTNGGTTPLARAGAMNAPRRAASNRASAGPMLGLAMNSPAAMPKARSRATKNGRCTTSARRNAAPVANGARQAEEERERKQSTGPRGRPTPRWGARGGLSRRPGIFRPKPTTDDKDES